MKRVQAHFGLVSLVSVVVGIALPMAAAGQGLTILYTIDTGTALATCG